MLAILRYSVVTTFENVTRHWKSFFLISVAYLLLSGLAGSITFFLYLMFESIFSGKFVGETMRSILSADKTSTIISLVMVPLMSIYCWYYLFFLKKGQGKANLGDFFQNMPVKGWGMSFVFAVVCTVLYAIIKLPFDQSGIGFNALLLGLNGQTSSADIFLFFIERIVSLIFLLLPYLGLVIVFSRLEFERHVKVGFRPWVKVAIAIFLLSICFSAFWKAIVGFADRFIFQFFNLIDPWLGIGSWMTILFNIFLVSTVLIFSIALTAHCLEYPFRERTDGNTDRREYVSTVPSSNNPDDPDSSDAV